jgi:ABC-2 type transport system permease protein
MKKLWAFLKRDFLIETSYRFSTLLQLASIVFTLTGYYYLARFVGLSGFSPDKVGAQGYFAFVLIGVAVHEYLTTSLEAFSRGIRESQLAGTLGALLSTQTSLPVIILLSAVYPLLWTSLVVVVYLAIGIGVFGVRFAAGSLGAAGFILLLSIIAFSGLGTLSASFVMVFKRGNPVVWLFGGLSWLLGGVLYPVSILPWWLRKASALLPITYAIEGLRAALLRGAPWHELWHSMAPLLLIAVIVFPLGIASFQIAARYTRIAGTLDQY